MSVGGHSRNYSGSVGSRPSLRSRTPSNPPPEVQNLGNNEPDFQPCAATASMFLYAEGSTIYCLHHDTLAIERKFEKHKEKVVLLSVDNVSESGQGRLAVSYDSDQYAIVWDIHTGQELSRFASYSIIHTAAWMRDGNIAFGNSHGEIIIFEPKNSEHVTIRTIYDPITALAPTNDCQTFAIGYQNGSVLIARLVPIFTILHTLSTSHAPSVVVGLAWHASSSKQKSDMLAIQKSDSDLRVWSVAKMRDEPPKIIRVLKRSDNVEQGRNWIAWSKNGRIIQYAHGETLAWDVRTKHVGYETVPTVENVKGIANFGPGAALFTIGPEGSVQQYELTPPALVRNVKPEPVERPSAQSTPKLNPRHIIGAAPPQTLYNTMDALKGGPQSLATIQEATSQAALEHAQQVRSGITSPVSTSSRAESASSRSSAGGGNGGYSRDRAPSVSSRAPSGTIFSALSTPMIARDSVASPFWASASVASSGRRSRGSRLKNEVLPSPEGPSVDLFPFTRQRLASLPYAPQQPRLDSHAATAEQLRRQMLSLVFGWEGDIEDMIRSEKEKHPPSSANAALLNKWLGDTNMNPLGMMASENISQTDWMLLALSNMSGAGEAGKQMGRSFAQKLINSGDIHTAATIHLGIDEYEEAIDVYVSRNYFMEGILLTCLLYPDEWQRQSHLVRRWGEYVVENSQQHLAVRCFTATGADASLPWASPTQSPFTQSQSGHLPNISSMLSPPVSPPGVDSPSKAQLMTSKNPALRLVTSFGQSDRPGYKFPGLKTDDGTPTAAPGITPIVDSALSPGGTPVGPRLLPSQGKRSKSHQRLPSIGETPIETNAPELEIPNTVKRLPTPETSGSDREKEVLPAKEKERERERNLPALSLNTQDLGKKSAPQDDTLPLLSATVYNPNEDNTPKPHATPQTAMPTTATKLSNSEIHALALARAREGPSKLRNGSRDRKPMGLQITMPSLDQVNLPQLTAGSDRPSQHHLRQSSNSSHQSNSTHSGKNSRDLDIGGDLSSAPLTGKSWASSVKSPSVSGRSIDPYISSLEEANYYAKKKKEALRAARSRERQSQSRHRPRENSNEHTGRSRSSSRYIQAPKRSPSSPIPMSPEDLNRYRQSHAQSIDAQTTPGIVDSSTDDGPARRRATSKGRSRSKVSQASYRTVREASPERRRQSSRPDRLRGNSRARSPDRLLSPIERGRSKSKGDGSLARSPSSPLPFSPQASLYKEESDAPNPMRLVEANQNRIRSRQRSRARSSSRMAEERASSRARREPSRDRRPSHVSQLSEQNVAQHTAHGKPESQSDDSTSADPSVLRQKSHRTLKKEKAALDLEARRISLINNSQQVIAHPSQLARPQMPERAVTDLGINPTTRRPSLPGTPPERSLKADAPNPYERSASAQPLLGLPATPRAMKHPKYQPSREDVPVMPAIPDQFYATGQPAFELARSASAPVPEPTDSGIHPAYRQNIRPSNTKRANFAPLHEIGRNRQSSVDATNRDQIGSIDETLQPIIEGEGEHAVIVVPEYHGPSHSVPTPPPAVLPQLAHLVPGGVPNDGPLPPPPPPKPAHMIPGNTSSIASGSGVGTINILMEGEDSANNSPPVPNQSYTPSPIAKSPPAFGTPNKSPPMVGPTFDSMDSVRAGATSPPVAMGHRRGRSIDNVSSRIMRVAERMRSNSRGRADNMMREREKKTKSPKPLTEGFGDGIQSGLKDGQRAPYETAGSYF